jgi:MazG family protein
MSYAIEIDPDQAPPGLAQARPDVAKFGAALIDAAALMARLRTPDVGCPWDLEQSFKTIAPYTIEEAYEVADAIARDAVGELRGELGDLLFQVLFHARLAEEAGLFDLGDVARGLTEKMVRRHPHVFATADGRSAADQVAAWEDIKAQERGLAGGETSVLDGVAKALPALARAEKLTKRAARIGFDWTEPGEVLAKLDEELAELRVAQDEGDQAHIHEEMGDALFVMANLARKLGVDPEAALRDANAKFERRFRHVERRASERQGELRPDLEELEAFWAEAKHIERSGG